MISRPPKKSETLEIRMPHSTKTAFMARCRIEGRTASDAVRGFIDHELTASVRRPSRTRGWHGVAAAAAVGLAIGAVAAPSLAETASAQATFDRLDRDGDGRLDPREFARR